MDHSSQSYNMNVQMEITRLHNDPVFSFIKDSNGEYTDIASANALDGHTSN